MEGEGVFPLALLAGLGLGGALCPDRRSVLEALGAPGALLFWSLSERGGGGALGAHAREIPAWLLGRGGLWELALRSRIWGEAAGRPGAFSFGSWHALAYLSRPVRAASAGRLLLSHHIRKWTEGLAALSTSPQPCCQRPELLPRPLSWEGSVSGAQVPTLAEPAGCPAGTLLFTRGSQEASNPEKRNSGVSSGSSLFRDAVSPAQRASPTASEAARLPPGGVPSAGTPIRSQCQLSRL